MRSIFTFMLFVWLCFFWAATTLASPPTKDGPPCNCGCVDSLECKCKDCPAAHKVLAPAAADQWVQVCTPEGCMWVKVSAPQGQPLTGQFQPTAVGSGCQGGSCGNQSFGQSFGTAGGGSCGSSSSGRWYPGKNLGRPVPQRLRK